MDGYAAKLSWPRYGGMFAYAFDMGDGSAHLCTLAEKRIDLRDELDEAPDHPVPYWSWRSLPDLYGRG